MSDSTSTSNTKLVEIKRKIANLIAKAESTLNEHESDAFMQKAKELLDKYNLERNQLDPSEWEDPVMHVDDGMFYYQANLWQGKLFAALSAYYGCSTLTQKIGRNKYRRTIVGRESAVTTAMLMYPKVKKQVQQQAKILLDNGFSKSKSTSEREVSKAVEYKLWILCTKYDRRESTDPQASNALTVQEENETYIDAQWSDVEDAKTRKTKGTSIAAMHAADNVNVTQDIKHQTKRLT